MATEREMLDLLKERYDKRDKFDIPRYQWIEHPKTYYKRHRRTLDAIALDRHTTKAGSKRVFLRHGFEIKCSRSDWLRELRSPDKAEAWSKYLHCFWLVVPDKEIVKPGELPENWGLLAPRSGKLFAQPTATIKATPNPIDGKTLNNLVWASIKTDRRENGERSPLGEPLAEGVVS